MDAGLLLYVESGQRNCFFVPPVTNTAEGEAINLVKKMYTESVCLPFLLVFLFASLGYEKI